MEWSELLAWGWGFEEEEGNVVPSGRTTHPAWRASAATTSLTSARGRSPKPPCRRSPARIRPVTARRRRSRALVRSFSSLPRPRRRSGGRSPSPAAASATKKSSESDSSSSSSLTAPSIRSSGSGRRSMPPCRGVWGAGSGLCTLGLARATGLWPARWHGASTRVGGRTAGMARRHARGAGSARGAHVAGRRHGHPPCSSFLPWPQPKPSHFDPPVHAPQHVC
uniref:Predicted protein n=1 Tax=Hordeum vulgare subsp. vulgare TaxID=112509 RepID=F2CVJ9_HORVV|nr:predicted protein [Hordeum vulgare subsp. vulgare]